MTEGGGRREREGAGEEGGRGEKRREGEICLPILIENIMSTNTFLTSIIEQSLYKGHVCPFVLSESMFFFRMI